MDLAKEVTTDKPYEWTETIWDLGLGHTQGENLTKHVVAYDFGIKRNILRLLVNRGCRVTVVPAQTPADKVLAMNPDGVFLSNGPGDPEPCTYAIEAIKTIVATKIPVFGICLGHQLLGLASGAKTVKMKFGHHGANHPVQEKATGRVLISSQNHGFAVDASSLPPMSKRPTIPCLTAACKASAAPTSPPSASKAILRPAQGHMMWSICLMSSFNT